MKIGEEIYDGFEGDELSPIWSHERFEEGAVKIQSEIVRKGNKAVQISIHKGDKTEEAYEGSKTSERDELMDKFGPKEDEFFSYSFSIYLPKDFLIVPTRLVLAQWKQYDENKKVLVDNPILALRYQHGEMRITLQTTEEKINLFRTKEEIRARWLDFKFNVNFSRTNKGFVKVWINKKKIIDYKGITAYSEKYNYPKPGRFYFKMGLYRDVMEEPMTVYFDEFKKKRLR